MDDGSDSFNTYYSEYCKNKKMGKSGIDTFNYMGYYHQSFQNGIVRA